MRIINKNLDQRQPIKPEHPASKGFKSTEGKKVVIKPTEPIISNTSDLKKADDITKTKLNISKLKKEQVEFNVINDMVDDAKSPESTEKKDKVAEDSVETDGPSYFDGYSGPDGYTDISPDDNSK